MDSPCPLPVHGFFLNSKIWIDNYRVVLYIGIMLNLGKKKSRVVRRKT